MAVDELLKKLRPLIPQEVASWCESLPFLELEARRVLERHVQARAADLLGDTSGKILLPPPPKTKATGTLKLGEVVYPGLPGYTFGLKKEELLQGLGIYGRSGAGKTTVVFALLRQLAKQRINFLFLDWKRTARHLVPELRADVRIYTPGRSVAPLEFNPLIPPPGMEQRTYITKVVDILASAYTLGDGSRNVLQRELLAAYSRSEGWPTADDVLKSLEQEDGAGRGKGWRESAIRAIQTLTFSGLRGGSEASQHELVGELLNASSVVELDGLGDNDKRALIPLLIQWLFEFRLQARTREQLELVVIIEEAHHVLYRSEHRSRESLMNQFLRQCRELGIGVVIVDQHPHLISSAALGNTFTSICLNMTEPSDASRAAAISLLPSDEKRYLGVLPVGQGIVRMRDRWHGPFVVQFDHEPIEKGAVTDEQLLCSGGRFGQSLVPSRTVAGDKDAAASSGVALASGAGPGRRGIPGSPAASTSEGLSQPGCRMLQDVLLHPADGMWARCKRLGLSSRAGWRLKGELEREGWVRIGSMRVGRTRRTALFPTSNALRLYGLATGPQRGSDQHYFWQHYWADRLRHEGYRVKVEAPRVGGRVDVLAEKAGERIGVEIETGKSDVVRNVENCQRSGYGRILVVATDAKALRKVKRELGQAELLARGCVRVAVEHRL